MEDQADATQPAGSPERSVGELVKEISELVPRLVRDELKLAQVEMTSKGKQAGLGAGLLGGSGLIALYGLACILACVIALISIVLPVWLAALIIGAALLAVSGGAALAGKGRLQKAAPPVPQEAVGSAQADIKEIKEKARR